VPVAEPSWFTGANAKAKVLDGRIDVTSGLAKALLYGPGFDPGAVPYIYLGEIDPAADVSAGAGGHQTLAGVAQNPTGDLSFDLVIPTTEWTVGASAVTAAGVVVYYDDDLQPLLWWARFLDPATGVPTPQTVQPGKRFIVDWLPDPGGVGGATPSDPDATENARRLLNVFYHHAQQAIPPLSGTMYAAPNEATPGSGGAAIDDAIFARTGKRFACRGFEMDNGPNKAATDAVIRDSWLAGYIPILANHFRNPVTGGPWDDTTFVDFDLLVAAGTPLHNTFFEGTVRPQAQRIKALQDAYDVAAVFRYPHEGNWRSGWDVVRNASLRPSLGGDPALHAAYCDRIREVFIEEGVHNLIYMYPPHEHDGFGWNHASWPSGSEYGASITGWEAMAPTAIDLGGVSQYGTSLAGKRDQLIALKELVLATKPAGWSEVGPSANTIIDVTAWVDAIQDPYVPSADPKVHGNSSGLDFMAWWMWWWTNTHRLDRQTNFWLMIEASTNHGEWTL
jgi:hypothetical protein